MYEVYVYVHAKFIIVSDQCSTDYTLFEQLLLSNINTETSAQTTATDSLSIRNLMF